MIKVAPFQPGQEILAAQILNASFAEWERQLSRAYGCRQFTPQQVLDWAQQPASALWLACVNGEPVGCVHCRVEQVRGQASFRQLFCEVTVPNMGQSQIAVLPQHRRKGVATAMLQTTLERLEVETALVLAYADNAAASALLSGLGFVHRERFYYPRYSDQEPLAFDSVYAELDLRQPLQDVPLNPAVKVRPPREDDVDELTRVFGECSPWVYGPQPEPAQVLAWIRKPWGEVTLVAEYQGRAVGAMEFSAQGLLGIPGVLPEFQNQGIGTTLFYHLLKQMQRRGHSWAVADTGIPQQQAIRMYHRLGFHIPRRLWAWVKVPNG